jgi:hypothetical protein
MGFEETSTELLVSPIKKYNQMVAVPGLFIKHKKQGYSGNTAIRAVIRRAVSQGMHRLYILVRYIATNDTMMIY